jgi:hypothetical protein
MNNSRLFSLNWKDIFNGFVSAFIFAVLTQIYQSADAGVLPTLTQLKASALVGLAAGVSYLIKKFVQNQDGKFLKK